jgi:AraC-like DNA-binding protein
MSNRINLIGISLRYRPWFSGTHHLLLRLARPSNLSYYMKRKDVQLIQEIREFLDENLYKEHSIVDLCRQFHINREKLQSGFRGLVQSTVHAYIIHQRIEHAAQRLLQSDDSIKVIALDSGYKKQRSFNKTFKSIYKLTPASYRKLHQLQEGSVQ